MLRGRLRRIEHLGAEVLLHVDLPAFAGQAVVARAASAKSLAVGVELALRFDPAAAHLFDAAGQRMLQAERVRATAAQTAS